MKSWRERARPIIARVLKETEGQDLKARRKALKDAYPWGPREHWPYKMWCSEVRRQLDLEATPPRGRKRGQMVRHTDDRTGRMF